ncbi:HlyD family secretion protein [Microbulbifer donghaiensis]|uniref:HlyD family secretion protein n=1 Tax=Microbulbifer donghaiensis TaxID=494016 RepID=A0A1M4ULN7_9GAMM|nr:efflux RND transporter periplasmic adaptor subunit [Microbulbifer donghaiensis]SHE57493.1 HlyD family secretion protein [Microbulbifer donghaiensis]
MSRKLIKRLIALALLAGLLIFLVFAFMPEPVPVDMDEVRRGPMQVSVSDEGYTRVHDVYVVSAPLTGYLLRIESEVGDLVVANKTHLADLLPTQPQFLDVRSRSQAEAAIRSAEAALKLAAAERRDAEAKLAFAQSDAKRARKLVKKGHISEVELDRFELALDSAEASLDTAHAAERMREGELENARAALIEPGEMEINEEDLVRVTSPVSGSVLRISQESERVVPAGTPLLEIGDPGNLEIVVDLLSRDAVRVERRAPVQITSWGGDQPLNGRVRLVEPFGFTKISALGIEEQRVNVIIDFVDPKEVWSRLGHGYRVDAAIEIWRADEVVQVPTGALFRHKGQWALFKVVDDRAVRTTVKVGHNNGQMAEILEGITPGEKVVLHPSERIEDGTTLKEREI